MFFLRALLAAGAASLFLCAGASAKSSVFVLVLDEMPASVIMDRSQQINARDFSSLARFSREATWYRNHTAVSDFTYASVPSIVLGQRPSGDPDDRNYAYDTSHSLFDLLRGYETNVWQPINTICRACPGPEPSSRLAGARLRSSGGYHPRNRYAAGAIKAIGALRQPSLTFVHALLPHSPWEFLPDGRSYQGSALGVPGLALFDWDEQEYAVAFNQQRMYLQSRFADRVVGDFLARIKRSGQWDSSIIIVTSDHGADFLPLHPRRGVTRERFSELGNVPMLIKYPGQSQGRVSDLPSNHTQVLATINAATVRNPAYEGTVLDQTPPDQALAMRPADRGFARSELGEMVEGRRQAIELRYRRLTDDPFPALRSDLSLLKRAAGRPRIERGSAWIRLNRTFNPRRGMLVATPHGLPRGSRIVVRHGGRLIAAGQVFEEWPEPQVVGQLNYRAKLAILMDPAKAPRSSRGLRFFRVLPSGLQPLPVR